MTTHQHARCDACGCQFRYGTDRGLWKKLVPCPTCGWMARGMVGQLRDLLHLVLATVSLAFVGLLFLAALVGMAISTWCVLAGWGGLTIAVAQCAVVMWNPNRSPAKHRDHARQLVASGVVTLKSPPVRSTAAGPESVGPPWSHIAWLALTAAAVVAMVSAEAMRRQKGWVDNQQMGILGPGDTFTVHFATDVKSIGALWTGTVTPEFVLTPERSTTIQGLKGVTRSEHWGDEIGRGERILSLTNQVAPWATITLPDREELNWRSVDLLIRLGVTYPEATKMYDPDSKLGLKKDAFIEKSLGIRETYHIVLSEAGARATYRRLWWVGGLGGALLLLVSSVGLAQGGLRSIVRRA